jgi:hypothetical protein
MYEEPPPLPFPSLPRIKHEARTIFEHYRHPATPELDIRFYEQESSAPTEQKRPRAARACDSCRAKKVKCDNTLPQKPCGKQNCSCEYHVQATEDSDNERTGQNEPSGSSSGPQDPKASQDMIPSTTVFRKPGLMYSGHFAGETSFCAYLPVLSQPPVLTEEDEFPTLNCISSCPYISPNDQLYLLETYYTHLNPFYPILNKDEMKKQLNLCMNGQKCYLSPLFFYALFARAAHIADRTATEDNHTFEEISQQAMAYAINLRTSYQDRPRVSTVLALIILANQLEQTKVHDNLTRSWLLAGEAFRLALDMGIHRSGNHDENDNNGQFCIRTFWLAYITDCTMSMTYGRPSATEEKVL